MKLIAEGDFQIRIGDFGFSRKALSEDNDSYMIFDNGDMRSSESSEQSMDRRNSISSSFSQMPPYQKAMLRSPESKSNKYNYKADLWGLGIIACRLMTRKENFTHQNYSFWKLPINDLNVKISMEFIDFIANIITKKDEFRQSTRNLLTHPFITQKKQVDMRKYLIYAHMHGLLDVKLFTRVCVNGYLRFQNFIHENFFILEEMVNAVR